MPATLPREIERKYLPFEDHLPSELYRATPTYIEQYYLNRPGEQYELRLRQKHKFGELAYTATIKAGSPPDRLEVETSVNPETYDFWQKYASTERIRKLRRTLTLAGGAWALDHYPELGMSLLEAEGIHVAQPEGCIEVTEDEHFLNYHIAGPLETARPYLPETTASQILEERTKDLVTRLNRPIIIGIAGATASGKTTLARQLVESWGDEALLLSQDHYYRGKSAMKARYGEDIEPNWDEPLAFDLHTLAKHLSELQQGRGIERPTYSMAISDPTGEKVTLHPEGKKVIILEGIHALNDTLIDWLDDTYYVEAPLATRLGRRLERDVAEGRGYAPEDNLRYMLEVAEPTFACYEAAQMNNASVILHT